MESIPEEVSCSIPILFNGSYHLYHKYRLSCPMHSLKVHKIENFFDSDFGICVFSLLVMSKY